MANSSPRVVSSDHYLPSRDRRSGRADQYGPRKYARDPPTSPSEHPLDPRLRNRARNAHRSPISDHRSTMKRSAEYDSQHPESRKAPRLGTPSDSGESTSRATIATEDSHFVPAGRGRDVPVERSGVAPRTSLNGHDKHTQKMADAIDTLTDAIERSALATVEQRRAKQYGDDAKTQIAAMQAHMADFPAMRDAYNKNHDITHQIIATKTSAANSARLDLQRAFESVMQAVQTSQSAGDASDVANRSEIMRLIQPLQDKMTRLEAEAEAREKHIKRLESIVEKQNKVFEARETRMATLESQVKHQDKARKPETDQLAEQLSDTRRRLSALGTVNDKLRQQTDSMNSRLSKVEDDVNEEKNRGTSRMQDYSALVKRVDETLKAAPHQGVTGLSDMLDAHIKDVVQGNRSAVIDPLVEHLKQQIAGPILDTVHQTSRQIKEHVATSTSIQIEMQNDYQHLFVDLETLRIEQRDANPDDIRMTRFNDRLQHLELRMDVLAGPFNPMQTLSRPPAPHALQNGPPSTPYQVMSPVPGPSNARPGPPGPPPSAPAQALESPRIATPGNAPQSAPTPPQRQPVRPGPAVLAHPTVLPGSPQGAQQNFVIPPGYRITLSQEHWDSLCRSVFDLVHIWFTNQNVSPDILTERINRLSGGMGEIQSVQDSLVARLTKAEQGVAANKEQLSAIGGQVASTNGQARARSNSIAEGPAASSDTLVNLTNNAVGLANTALSTAHDVSTRVTRLDGKHEDLRSRVDDLAQHAGSPELDKVKAEVEKLVKEFTHLGRRSKENDDSTKRCFMRLMEFEGKQGKTNIGSREANGVMGATIREAVGKLYDHIKEERPDWRALEAAGWENLRHGQTIEGAHAPNNGGGHGSNNSGGQGTNNGGSQGTNNGGSQGH